MADKERKFYNLFWSYDNPKSKKKDDSKQKKDGGAKNIRRLPIFVNFDGTKSSNRIQEFQEKPAIILYPSLLTPAVVVGDEKLDIILAVRKNDKLDESHVLKQLKISDNLDTEKLVKYSIIVSKEKKNIIDKVRIDNKFDSYDDLLKAGEKFAGLLAPHIKEKLEEDNFTDIYHVSMPNPKNCFTHASKGLKVKGTTEISDEIIKEELIAPKDDKTGKSIGTKEDKLYAYKFEGEHPTTGKYDKENPILSYHPVFCYEKDFEYADIGFVSDMHLNARQEYLKKSTAQVIEDPDSNYSPPIGKHIDIASHSFAEILDEIGQKADVLVVCGDLIDYNRNTVTDKVFDKTTKPSEIWDFVNLKDDDKIKEKDQYKKNYKNGVDFTTFYTLIIDFYKRYKKPIFAVTGNHDFYAEPYGISPRINILSPFPFPIDSVVANAGVPSDHNLTTYEAILAFGPSYAEVKKRSSLNPLNIFHGNFYDDTIKWFRFVLTPFSDFSVKLLKQQLVGFDWGEGEDIIGSTQATTKVPLIGGVGHLPQADCAITDNQMKLFDSATSNPDIKTICFSHFTIISYADRLHPHYKDSDGNIKSGKEGQINFSGSYSEEYNKYNNGTFVDMREKFYKKLAENKIQAMVTGHFHKTALYFFGPESDSSIKTYYYEVEEYQKAIKENKNIKGAVVLTAGAAGLVPRSNKYGEFHGWGDDYPTAILMKFDKNGEIEEIIKIQSTNKSSKPRFVVALDAQFVCGGLKDKVTTVDEWWVDDNGERVDKPKGHNWYNYEHLPWHDKTVETEVPAKVFNKFASVESGSTTEDKDFSPDNDVAFDIDVNYKFPPSFSGVDIDNVVLFYMDKKTKEWTIFTLKDPTNVKVGDEEVTRLKLNGSVNALKLTRLFRNKKGKKDIFLSIKFKCSNSEITKKYDFDSRWNFPGKLTKSDDENNKSFFEVEKKKETSDIQNLLKWYTKKFPKKYA